MCLQLWRLSWLGDAVMSEVKHTRSWKCGQDMFGSTHVYNEHGVPLEHVVQGNACYAPYWDAEAKEVSDS